MSFWELFAQGDAVSRGVALLLLAMSVASWVVILWKAWLLPRAVGGVARGVAAFWQAPSLDDARQKVAAFDREFLVLPLIEAARAEAPGTLAAAGDRSQQLTRLLRDALHVALNKLQNKRNTINNWLFRLNVNALSVKPKQKKKLNARSKKHVKQIKPIRRMFVTLSWLN